MFRKAIHIALSVLLFLATTGVSLSKQSCEPASAPFRLFEASADHCSMPPEDCHTYITSIKIQSSILETSHSTSVDQFKDHMTSSLVSVRPDDSDKEPVVIFSSGKVPKIQTVLARLQSYLL